MQITAWRPLSKSDIVCWSLPGLKRYLYLDVYKNKNILITLGNSYSTGFCFDLFVKKHAISIYNLKSFFLVCILLYSCWKRKT